MDARRSTGTASRPPLRLAMCSANTPTAVGAHYTENINASLWKVALFIAVATLILLMFFLRSIVLPLKAVLMTALTVAASYGVLVVIFQWRAGGIGRPPFFGPPRVRVGGLDPVLVDTG